jgi:anthranilate phosphoribosyltransferase
MTTPQTYDEFILRGFGRAIMEVTTGHHLSREETKEIYRQILLAEQPDLHQGAFLAAHIANTPTLDEIAGAWEAQMEYDVETIDPALPAQCADIVGTGSDYLKTINASSGAAILAAAAGAYVAKKGARAATGVSGSSDIFEAFGVDLEAPLSQAAQSLEKHRLCYIPGEKFLRSGWGRLIRVMRFRTIFNLACPLLMPCRPARHLVIGAYSAVLARQLVQICREVGMAGALGIYGRSDGYSADQGMDEISVCGPTLVVELRGDSITEYTLEPEDLGLPRHKYEDIAAKADTRENTLTLLGALSARTNGAAGDFLSANAAAVLYLLNLAPSWPAAVEQARQTLAQGAAVETLRRMVGAQQGQSGHGAQKLEQLLEHVGEG